MHEARARAAREGVGSPWLEGLEPLAPLLLAVHGVMLLVEIGGTSLDWSLVVVTAALGAVGVLGRRSRAWVVSRAWILLAIAWLLLLSTGGVGSFFALWLFTLSPVYSLVLGGRMAVVYPILLGVAYLTLTPMAEAELLPVVLWGRAAVLISTGLLVAAIAAARERARDEAGRREEARLRELIASKDEFVASVSHELRTPLTAVVGLAAELKSDVSRIPDSEIEEFAAIIHHQAVEMAHIVDDLLVAARADIGQVVVEFGPVDLRRELEAVIAEQPDPFHTAPRLPAVHGRGVLATADEARVRQIIRNLLANAIHYGGNRIEGRILAEGRRAVLEIADNGAGIPAEAAGDLFAPYRTFHHPGRQPSSVGLGLSVSRTLARLMAGELSYERRDGWSVFRLELPAASL